MQEKYNREIEKITVSLSQGRTDGRDVFFTIEYVNWHGCAQEHHVLPVLSHMIETAIKRSRFVTEISRFVLDRIT